MPVTSESGRGYASPALGNNAYLDEPHRSRVLSTSNRELGTLVRPQYAQRHSPVGSVIATAGCAKAPKRIKRIKRTSAMAAASLPALDTPNGVPRVFRPAPASDPGEAEGQGGPCACQAAWRRRAAHLLNLSALSLVIRRAI